MGQFSVGFLWVIITFSLLASVNQRNFNLENLGITPVFSARLWKVKKVVYSIDSSRLENKRRMQSDGLTSLFRWIGGESSESRFPARRHLAAVKWKATLVALAHRIHPIVVPTYSVGTFSSSKRQTKGLLCVNSCNFRWAL